MPEPYCRAATAALVLPEQQEVRLPVWLSYHPYDCFAARLTFWTHGAEGVTWIFAWELLAAGLAGPAGRGDVRVGPVPGAGEVLLSLGRDGSGERAHLRLPAADVECFVAEIAGRAAGDLCGVRQALDDELVRLTERA